MTHLTYVIYNPTDSSFEPQKVATFKQGRDDLKELAKLGIAGLVLELHHEKAVDQKDFRFPQKGTYRLNKKPSGFYSLSFI